LAGVGALALGGTATAIAETVPWQRAARPEKPPAPVEFYGDHQPGIATTPPSALVLTAFDLATNDRASLVDLLKRWSSAAEALMRGELLDTSTGSSARLRDSGETRGLPPASLTLTVGFGPGAFDAIPELVREKPPGLSPIPPMRGDALDDARGGGDLVVQACADDEMVAFHATRQLTRLAKGIATPRWSQRGFGATTDVRRGQTPRNLFGQKDGTANPQPGTLGFDPVVWVQPGDSPPWMVGGAYLAVRRIRMDLDRWDLAAASQQNKALGRDTVTGAPLSGGGEFSAPDFGATDNVGQLTIPADAHIRVANPAFNDAAEMLRRGYSYDDGYTDDRRRDAGLIFMAYVRDVPQQFTPVLRALTERDAMHAFLTHAASAVFAIPPGCQPGGFLGDTLLG